MGVTDSKQIHSQLEVDYKFLRKYCDTVYGQITVIQHRASKRQYALIQKTYLQVNSQFQKFLQDSKNKNYFLKPQKVQYCKASICSDMKIYFFHFEYAPFTLESQIRKRSEQKNYFRREEAVFILLQQVQILQLLRTRQNPQTSRGYRFIITNSFFLCSPLLQLRVLEPVFKKQLQQEEELESYYLSPQAKKMLFRGERFKVKDVSYKQPSLIFTLGLCFTQCLLLADLSLIYEENSQQINFQQLNIACQQILQNYGQEIYSILTKMLQYDPQNRVSLRQLSMIMRNLQSKKLMISRYRGINGQQT